MIQYIYKKSLLLNKIRRNGYSILEGENMDKNNFELGNAEKSKLYTIKEENKYDYKLEDFQYDSKRKNDSHVAIINAIEKKSTVLDIGCATGLIANILKKEKNCIVDGIEYDKEAFEICKKNASFRRVYHFSITDKNDKEYQKFFSQKEKYDYIILADILEHLVNPWDVLLNIYECLDEKGKIIISLPNVAHIDIIKGLMNGTFNYNTLGLLDTTHLRFFTFRSFCDLILNISKTANIYYDIERIEKILSIPNYITNVEEYSLYNLNNYLEDYFVLQNIIVLTKSKDNKVHIKGDNEINNGLFDKMLESYNFIKEKNSNLFENVQKNEELIQKLTLEKSDLKIQLNDFKLNYRKMNDRIGELENQNYELYLIRNSKRWKWINKICNYFHFFR